MKKLIAAVLTLLTVAGYTVAALAECPPGTKEECYGTASGKRNCVCR
jgi:uncharacterized membrane protein